jgi:ribonucleoside-diphosphate reductase alpha chain
MKDIAEFRVIEPGSISEWVWENKYRGPSDRDVQDTFMRVAIALARDGSEIDDFMDAMTEFEFLPAGRILAGAGTGRQVTLMNCYVMGTIEDSLEGIMRAVTEAALTLKQGGGVGMDFSTIRPRGSPVRGVDSTSSGAVSFMDLWDAMCRTIESAGIRRGAMMGVLRCDHPDIEEFIAAKRTVGRLTSFNISVGVTDAFMEAVRADADWPLLFAAVCHKTVKARDLWEKIMRSTYDASDPGVLFLDRINKTNPLADVETIAATNPCGEQPLPPYGACLLGSINLARLVLDPFTPDARLDDARLDHLAGMAVRLLDRAIDVSGYPLPQQREEALTKRRIGIGVMGLADALEMLGLDYDGPRGSNVASKVTKIIAKEAAAASIGLASAYGTFHAWKPGRPTQRNSHLTSIAPTGTISLFAGNVSSGIEPIFSLSAERRVRTASGQKVFKVEDYAYRLAKHMGVAGGREWPVASEISPKDHLAMVAACQPFVDSAISKTINCPADISYEDFKGIYLQSYDAGLKGCTTYRDVRGDAVLSVTRSAPAAPAVTVAQPVAVGVAEREPKLTGATYKLRVAGNDHALYVTINDVEQDGRRRPFEVFFNSKNVEGFAWTVALSRMISAVFRKGGDIGFVVDELKSVFDPRGGTFLDGAFCPSMCAAIGGVIGKHLQAIGYQDAPSLASAADAAPAPVSIAATGAKLCPHCNTGIMVRSEGCEHCRSCTYTRCD